MKARQLFDRLLHLQYRLDCTPPEESPQIFEDFDQTMLDFQSLTGLSEDQIQDALNQRYADYVRSQKGK